MTDLTSPQPPMTAREWFKFAMNARRMHPRGSMEHGYMTRTARKLAWIVRGIPSKEWCNE